MFADCSELVNLNIDGWDLSTVISYGSVFTRCNKLTNITGAISGIRNKLDVSASPLTNDSAMVLINGLDTSTGSIYKPDKTIIFSSATYNTLSDEQKAIATNKGWTVTSK